jgi:small conductance mechanosensitive channel
VGDVVDTGVATGTVEGVSLRTTRLRSVDGTVWHIPNGTIARVGNMSQQWSRALLDVSVSYDTDLFQARDVIDRVAQELAQDPEFRPVVLGDPEVWGVESLDSDRVLLRLVVRTRPLEQWRVARELRARLKAAFDEAGIGIPLGPGITYRADAGTPTGTASAPAPTRATSPWMQPGAMDPDAGGGADGTDG